VSRTQVGIFFPFFLGLNLAQESNNETKLFKRTKDQNHEKTLLNTSASFLAFFFHFFWIEFGTRIQQ
jgi:hypothetical protein